MEFDRTKYFQEESVKENEREIFLFLKRNELHSALEIFF